MKLAIGLGASMGDRRRTLERTVVHLGAHAGLTLLRCSRWYRTPPMPGGTARGWFLNGVALYETDRTPEAVLARCRHLETASGRRRAQYWGDRPLDLDLLVAEGLTRDTPTLTLPHPGVAIRPFVWWPLREVWPEMAEALRGHESPPDASGMVPIGAFAHRPAAAYGARHAEPRTAP